MFIERGKTCGTALSPCSCGLSRDHQSDLCDAIQPWRPPRWPQNRCRRQSGSGVSVPAGRSHLRRPQFMLRRTSRAANPLVRRSWWPSRCRARGPSSQRLTTEREQADDPCLQRAFCGSIADDRRNLAPSSLECRCGFPLMVPPANTAHVGTCPCFARRPSLSWHLVVL
jgi:hypothetical protein